MGRLASVRFALITVLFSVGCDSPGVLHPLTDDLERNRAVWDSLPGDHYVYVVEHQCFCPVEARGPVEVEVADGVVTGRTYVDTQEEVAAEFLDLFPSVEGLFSFLEHAIEVDAATIRVTWDEDTGVPVEIWVDYVEAAADEEAGYVVRTLPYDPGG